VRFWNAEKGFGFLSKDEGGDDVYISARNLPDGVTSLRSGQKVDFGVAETARGESAISLQLLEAPPSIAKARRKSKEQMAVIVEDLIKMLDALGNGYRHGRYPDPKHAQKTATVLRAVADELEL
jgi:CspA family cold shock protein